MYDNNTYSWTTPILFDGLNSSNSTALAAQTTADEASTVANNVNEQVNGDPISYDEGLSMNIDDGLKIIRAELYGNTTQNGTPTPTAPQQVNVVKGKNLLNPNWTNRTAYGVTITNNNDGTFTLNGTSTYSSSFSLIGDSTDNNPKYIIDRMKENVGKYVTISTGETTNQGFYLQFNVKKQNDTQYGYISRVATFKSTIISSTEAEAKGGNIFVGINAGSSFNNVVIRPMLTITDTQITSTPDYIPYNTIQAKVVGKNLLENNSITQTKNGVTYTVNQDKSITLNGTSTQAFVVEINNNLVLDSGNYNLSLNGRIQGCGIYAYVGANVLKVYVSSNSATDNYQSNFTLDSRTIFTQIRIDIQANKTFNNVTIYPQLEKSSTATTYEAYKSNNYPITLGDIELCKIGTYQDRIYKNNGKWYLEKQVGKYQLQGTEAYSLINNAIQTQSEIPSNIESIDSSIMAYSNYFNYHYYATGITSNIQNGEFGWNAGKKLTMKIANITTYNDYVSWITTNKPSFYYQLATPTTTEITDETLLEQLEALNNAPLYSGITNILSIGNLPAYLNIAYYNNNFNGNFTNFNEITDSINEKTESVQHDLVNNYVQNGTFNSYTESTNNKLDDLDNFKTETDKAINGNNKLHYICNGTESGKYYFTYDNVSYYFTMPTVQANSKLIFDIDDKELKLNDTVITTSNTGTGTELKFVYDDPGLIRTVTESSAWINTNGETVEIVAQTYSTNMSTLNNLVTDTDKMIKNFNFGGDGLTITADKDDTTVNTKMNLNITNEAVRIRHGSENMMTLDPEGIHFSEVTFREIRLGDYLFKDEENGGFGFMYDPQNNN